MTRERNYGIDLLRLVLMYMVCMLHILGQGGVLSSCVPGTAKYAVFWFLEICAYCAVDGFAIITGYTASNRSMRYDKIVVMWFQALFYSLVLTVILSAVGLAGELSGVDIIILCFPVTFKTFWYFNAYLVMFLAMPILNCFLFSMNEEQAKKVFVLLVGLFSLIGFLGDAFGVLGGYSAIWLMVLYCLGVCARKIGLFEKAKAKEFIFVFMLNVAVILASVWIGETEYFVSYVSLPILINAFLLVILFSRLQLKGTYICRISPLAFGIYLFQMNGVVWNNILKDFCAVVADWNLIVGIIYVLGAALVLFVVGLTVEFLRRQVERMLKIPALSQQIVGTVERLLEKVTGKL